MEQKTQENIENKNIETSKRTASKRQIMANARNSFKTGKYSKYFNPGVAEFIKNPQILAGLMAEAIDKLKDANLSEKDRIFYLNTLSNVYKTIFGTKALNLNMDVNLTQPALLSKLREQYGTTATIEVKG